jgi:hypothetical protein
VLAACTCHYKKHQMCFLGKCIWLHLSETRLVKNRRRLGPELSFSFQTPAGTYIGMITGGAVYADSGPMR